MTYHQGCIFIFRWGCPGTANEGWCKVKISFWLLASYYRGFKIVLCSATDQRESFIVCYHLLLWWLLILFETWEPQIKQCASKIHSPVYTSGEIRLAWAKVNLSSAGGRHNGKLSMQCSRCLQQQSPDLTSLPFATITPVQLHSLVSPCHILYRQDIGSAQNSIENRLFQL